MFFGYTKWETISSLKNFSNLKALYLNEHCNPEDLVHLSNLRIFGSCDGSHFICPLPQVTHVLLDISSSAVSGTVLKRRYPNLKVFVFTGHGETLVLPETEHLETLVVMSPSTPVPLCNSVHHLILPLGCEWQRENVAKRFGGRVSYLELHVKQNTVYLFRMCMMQWLCNFAMPDLLSSVAIC